MQQASQWIRVAHRGASGHAPENTLAAFSKAIEIGVDGVELDVHASADDQPVVIHDGKLNRTTDRRGNVRELTMAQIQEADAGSWFGAAFAQERVPTLADALDLIKGHALTVIEIKALAAVQPVVSAIRQTAAADQVVVISFHPEALVQFHALEPGIPMEFLIGGGLPGDARAHAVECVRRTCETGTSTLDAGHGMITAEFAQEVRKRGVNLWAWTVDDVERMRQLVAWGVQGITSNYPDRFELV